MSTAMTRVSLKVKSKLMSVISVDRGKVSGVRCGGQSARVWPFKAWWQGLRSDDTGCEGGDSAANYSGESEAG